MSSFKRFPGWYTAGIGVINFTEQIVNDDPVEEAKQADNEIGHDDGWCIAGHLLPDENKIELSTREAEFSEDLQTFIEAKTFTDPETALRATNARLIQKTKDHEVTHYAHFHTLTVETLRKWELARRKDVTDVTEYVKRCREKGDKIKIAREDLCETVMQFKSEPERLLWDSYIRFVWANELFQEFDPAVGAVLKNAEHRSKQGEVILYTQIAADMEAYRLKKQPDAIERNLEQAGLIKQSIDQERTRLTATLESISQNNPSLANELRTRIKNASFSDSTIEAELVSWQARISEEQETLTEQDRRLLIGSFRRVLQLRKALGVISGIGKELLQEEATVQR